MEARPNLGLKSSGDASRPPPSDGAEGYPPTRTPRVFVSYSHKDERWKSKVVRHLRVCCQSSPLDLWDDRRIGAGEDWREAIYEAMRSAATAVILVSANSLTSEFILREEVKELLARRQQEGLPVFAVVISPCDWHGVDWLSRLQLRPADGKPLSTLRAPQADTALALIAGEVRDFVARQWAQPVEAEPECDVAQSPGNQTAVLVETALAPIEITINRSFSSFTQQEQTRLLSAIGTFLDIGGELRLISKRPGSVKLTLALTSSQAEKLYWAVERGEFADFGVTEAALLDPEILDRAEDIAAPIEEPLAAETPANESIFVGELGKSESRLQQRIFSGASTRGERTTTLPRLSGASRALDLKQIIHTKLVHSLDLSRVGDVAEDVLRRDIRKIVEHLCDTENPLLNRMERERLIEEVLDETFGFGPLELLLKDPTVGEIMVNGPLHVYVERHGKLEKTDVRFRDDSHLLQIIDRFVSKIGRRVDETCPMVEARMPDGSRVSVVIPPIALDGPSLSIRPIRTKLLNLEDLLNSKSFSVEMAQFLEACIKARLNILISGGASCGKTTLLNTLSSLVPGNERVVTIEDAAELQLPQDHVVRLETRPPNVEGRGAITVRDCFRHALRTMRPDRVIIGEIRGAEALDVLQAMNSRHAGLLATLNAESPRETLSRLEMMIMMGGVDWPLKGLRQLISSAIDVIIQINRLQGGPRKITQLTEVMEIEQETIITQEVFRYRQLGIDQNGRAFGQFEATGVRPTFVSRLEAQGIKLPSNMFAERILLRD